MPPAGRQRVLGGRRGKEGLALGAAPPPSPWHTVGQQLWEIKEAAGVAFRNWDSNSGGTGFKTSLYCFLAGMVGDSSVLLASVVYMLGVQQLARPCLKKM